MNVVSIVGWIVFAVLLLIGAYVIRTFRREITKARNRVAVGSDVFQSRFGSMEFAVAGTGPPTIMIHGTGGGFDQGLAFAEELIADAARHIASSIMDAKLIIYPSGGHVSIGHNQELYQKITQFLSDVKSRSAKPPA